ncbi:hypothetical protein [Actinoplanes sp. NPDC049599]|uniref:hypothetical protein n=1 Tax=Actinoplanes sp. NPDC049599 TaxID=3363903 RepID=UPI00378ACF74
MDNARLFAALVYGAWGLAVLLAALWIAWCLLRGLVTDTHEGASLDSTTVIVLPIEDEPVGHHRLGAIEHVPTDYTPHIGRRLIARETETQRIEYPR